jgi:hypothetical protein
VRKLCFPMFFLCFQAAAQIPPGFTPIFNGKDLSGWHTSEIDSHGNTKAWTVKDGVMTGTQDPPGNGGILLTDRKYRDFEISLDVMPDFGCDGGVFLRSNERGQAYQVMIDYLEGGSVGGVTGEGLGPLGFAFKRGNIAHHDRNWRQFWKENDWNRIRARIEGAVPHIQVWLNGAKVLDWTDFANHLPDGAAEGMIALQVHRNDPTWKSQRWRDGGYHRFRNIAVKELE